jgi:hypothetical protein
VNGYVLAAWLSCGSLLALYTLRTLLRERSLRRALTQERTKWR